MVKLRLRRAGAKKRPFYRIVAAPSTAPRDGRFIETIGYYNPITDPATVVVNDEKAIKWLSKGAQPTERVTKLLTISGTMERFTAMRQSDETAS